MKREWLKEKCPNLTDAEIDAIMSENGSDINKAKGDTKKLEDEVKTLKGENKTLEGQLTTANGTIEDLKKSNPDSEALQNKIKEHEGTIEKLKKDHDAEVAKLARDAINTELVGKYKAKNAKAVMALIDEFEAKDNEDYKTLLDSKLKSLSESEDTKFMFGDPQTKTPYNPAGGGDPDTKGYAAKIASQRNTGAEQSQTQNNPYANAWG